MGNIGKGGQVVGDIGEGGSCEEYWRRLEVGNIGEERRSDTGGRMRNGK